MSSATLSTILTMVESLPDSVQEQVADHLREFIADLDDEAQWDATFKQTQDVLVNAARKAKQEIALGQSVPMDYIHTQHSIECRANDG